MQLKHRWIAILVTICIVLGSATLAFAHWDYYVQRGDTLASIARRFDTTIQEIAEANNIANPNFIYVGQYLFIPGEHDDDGDTTPEPTPIPPPCQQGTHVVQRGETLFSIGLRYGFTVTQMAEANGITNPNFIYAGQVLIIPCGDGGTEPPPATQPPPTPTAVIVPTRTPTPPSNATNTPVPIPTNTPVPVPTNTPAPVDPTATPAPVGDNGFMLGGQTHTFANPDSMQYARMEWVKFQHKWSVTDSPDVVKGRIDDAQARGFKVLLSIPGAQHDSIDYDAYVNFLGGVAALGPDAIEVWNEQNIDREWPNGQIDPTLYVNSMLKPAYQRIKSINPEVLVISGAPAPTGFFGGACTGAGCDDQPYIEGMVAAGGIGYLDCVGVHYNEGILPPSQTAGDPRGNPNHYTRYFWTMVNTYNSAVNFAKPLCFTELGYLSGDDYGGVPAGFAWAADTSIQEHATWLGDAVRLAKNNQSIQMLIVFNVDFTLYAEDPQAGFAMIRRDGSCPACETVRAAME